MRVHASFDALTLIRILRRLPLSLDMHAHLTDCEVYEILDRARSPWLPALSKRNVFGMRALPPSRSAQIIVHPALKL